MSPSRLHEITGDAWGRGSAIPDAGGPLFPSPIKMCYLRSEAAPDGTFPYLPALDVMVMIVPRYESTSARVESWLTLPPVDPQHPLLTPFEHPHLTLHPVSGLGDKAWWVPQKSELAVAAGDRGYVVDLLTSNLADSELEGASIRIVKLVMN